MQKNWSFITLCNLNINFVDLNLFFLNSVKSREHDFNNDSRLDGLEILAAIKHSDLANDLKIDTRNLKGEELKNAYEKEINHYAGLNLIYFS